MTTTTQRSLSKVPEVTLLFWLIKIAATTLPRPPPAHTASGAASNAPMTMSAVATLVATGTL